ncbi:TetR/AcrR family transcriptional regulator [Xanthobacter sp. TB0136]|uniref:TetR/AcrR family transcriptional regulator n=1 Tax=Xanthobacter sp. TB0136 TaxID=3459177 RepID=UPI004039ABFD
MTHMANIPVASSPVARDVTENLDGAGAATSSHSGAGQDPEKRRQILAGARQMFLERGFDAASMGDIARAAGVSKGTLYVYFQDKEDLFSALVSNECGVTAELLFVLDSNEPDIAKVLTRLGTSFIEAMVRPEHIATLRTVIAIGSRFPDIGVRFFEAGPCVGVRRLAEYLQQKVDQGALAIDDVELAASQFLSLCKDGITLPILLGSEDSADSNHTDKVVAGAVHMFMRTYADPRRRIARKISKFGRRGRGWLSPSMASGPATP